jgi:hypothetical protein
MNGLCDKCKRAVRIKVKTDSGESEQILFCTLLEQKIDVEVEECEASLLNEFDEENG